ncbi:MAG: PIN domain-containing protein [bacterium]
MKGFLIDTTLLVDVLRSHKESITYLSKCLDNKQKLTICALSAYELFKAPITIAEENKIIGLFGLFETIDFTFPIAELAGILYRKYRKQGRTPTVPDLFIAATALLHELTLITSNTEDFAFITGLTVIKPY